MYPTNGAGPSPGPGAPPGAGPSEVGSPTRQGERMMSMTRREQKGLRILFIGGTGFIGPHMVRRALDRGHTVTLFNRGRTNPQLFPTVEKLLGDRNGDLKSLEDRQWDAVIDNSATDPKWVELSASLLQKNVKRYVFISTRSVYFDT